MQHYVPAGSAVITRGEKPILYKVSSALGAVRPIVFYGPVSVLISAVIFSLVNFDGLLKVTTELNDWIIDNFSYVFSWSTFAFVLTCVWVFFSPIGKVTIGGKGAKPLLSRWNWFSITLCTTIAIGILFWATAEPVFHLMAPPNFSGAEPGSQEAATFAVSTLYMHWSFTPYAIYTVPALAFALSYYNFGKSYSLTGPVSVLIGRPVGKLFGQVIDAIALFALMAGVAASLGAGMLSISGGLSNLLGISNSPLLQALVTAAIVGAFVISSITGLQRGIKFLSDLNSKFFFGACAFILVAGPTGYMLTTAADALLMYVSDFVTRSLVINEGDESWSAAWTVFYWANWLAWAPITALFLGRISRGYTVRQFVTVNFVLPSLFAIVWMSIFGGAALSLDMETGLLAAALEENGPEAIAYALLEQYPAAFVIMLCFLLISFISYVTAADSNTEAITGVCLNTEESHDPELVDKVPSAVRIKIFLALLIGASAYVMTAFSGIDGVRMMSNLGGLPALIIVLLLNAALLMMTGKHAKRLSSDNTNNL